MADIKGVQFGRLLEVNVFNFNTNEVVTFSGFDMECEFYKTDDAVNEASIGRVAIYNMTDETFNKIDITGCELEVKFGYEETNSKAQRLFIASVVSVDRHIDGSNIVTVFQVSLNFREYNFTPVSLSKREKTIASIITQVGEYYDAVFKIDLANIPKEHQSKVSDYLTLGLLPKFTFNGTLNEFLKRLNNDFGLTNHAVTEGTTGNNSKVVKELVFTFRDNYVPTIINKVNKPYAKIKEQQELDILFQRDTSDVVTILTHDTGLIGTPQVEYKIQRVSEYWQFTETDQQTFESQVRQQNKNIREANAAAKRAEREAKAKEKGKTLKPRKPRKAGTISVKRKYLKARALPNVAVRPLSIIEIQSKLKENSGLYRVRGVHFSINNFKSDVYMEMTLESVDTEDKVVYVDPTSDGDFNFNGSLGSEYTVGSESDLDTGGFD